MKVQIDNNICIDHEIISDKEFKETYVCGMDDEENSETTQHGTITSIAMHCTD